MAEDQARAAALAWTLTTAFERVQRERMHGVAMLNHALHVQAVGLARRPDGHWLGALVTPWFLNLILLPPASGPACAPVGWPGEGQRRRQDFPATALVFLGGWEDGVGAYQSCALFSDMRRFTSTEEACEVAREALAALDRSPQCLEPDQRRQTARPRPSPPGDPSDVVSPGKRRFLFGGGT